MNIEEKYNEELTKLKELKTSLEEKIKNFEENKRKRRTRRKT